MLQNDYEGKWIELLQGTIHNLRKEIDGAAVYEPDLVPSLERRLMIRECQLYAAEQGVDIPDSFVSKAISLSEELFLDVCKQLENRENETAYGEPQAFISLENGRSVEITFEQYGLPENEHFYDLRLHCSDEEAAFQQYASSVGVVTESCTSSASLEEVKEGLLYTLLFNEAEPVRKVLSKETSIQQKATSSPQHIMPLKMFLSHFDFGYDVYENNNPYEMSCRKHLIEDGRLESKYLHAPLIGLIDRQGADYGHIEGDRFPIDQNLAANIISRMDVYLQDGIVSEFADAMEEHGFDSSHLSLREMYYISKGLGVEEVSYNIADVIINPDKIYVPELDPYAKLDNYLSTLMSEMSNNAWAGKEPTTVHLSDGTNMIEIHGYTYEPHYEDFSATASISLNHKILYGLDSRNVAPYRNETCQIGAYDNLESAIAHIKDICKIGALTVLPDKKPSLQSQIQSAALRTSSGLAIDKEIEHSQSR